MSSNSGSPTERTDGGHSQRQQPRLVNNWISHLGFVLVAIAIMLLVTFALFSLVVGASTPYFNFIGFLVLPGILVMGLLIVPLGMAINYVWRVRGVRRGRATSLPRIDLNDAGTRKVLLWFLAASFCLVLPTLAVSSYEGYRYTESTAFCAKVCHTVMEPQATAHASSGHARVSCAACHIGEGAGWFVKSKLSGTRQVFAVLFDTYQRPIPPAIAELRPARETCEHCHWPAKFFGSQYREYPHYSPDEQNTKRTVKMFVKTGGADDALGRVEGIHAHMILSASVEYVATDNTLQEIPWVRYIARSGKERIYRSDGKPAGAPRPEGLVRTVDCMDCHNRGAHHFYPPQMALDRYLSAGRIDDTLPFIKQQATAALTVGYRDAATAEAAITRALTEFYQTQYPAVWKRRQPAVHQACESVVQIYRRDFFPTMKEDWATYPENIGHLYSPGCLRCHDGLHLDEAGARISANCDVCHVFLVPVDEHSDAVVRGEYQHTMDLAQHKKLRCSQCHNGGRLLLCRDCHAERMREGQWEEGQFHPDLP